MLCYDQAALRVYAVVAGLCKTYPRMRVNAQWINKW